MFLFSCEKKSCWECTTFTENKYIYNPALTNYDTEDNLVCDKDWDQIRDYEDSRTDIDTVRIGIPAYHYVHKITCICLEQ
jgi:hypothetical protein